MNESSDDEEPSSSIGLFKATQERRREEENKIIIVTGKIQRYTWQSCEGDHWEDVRCYVETTRAIYRIVHPLPIYSSYYSDVLNAICIVSLIVHILKKEHPGSKEYGWNEVVEKIQTESKKRANAVYGERCRGYTMEDIELNIPHLGNLFEIGQFETSSSGWNPFQTKIFKILSRKAKDMRKGLHLYRPLRTEAEIQLEPTTISNTNEILQLNHISTEEEVNLLKIPPPPEKNIVWGDRDENGEQHEGRVYYKSVTLGRGEVVELGDFVRLMRSGCKFPKKKKDVEFGE